MGSVKQMRAMVVGGANEQAVSSGRTESQGQILGVLGEQTSLLLLLDNPNFEAPNLFHACLTANALPRLSNN